MEDTNTKKKSIHAEREEKTLAFWNENQIFAKSLHKNLDSGKNFTFYEGPPTANGMPGLHHLEARAFKDAIPRYKTMQGFYVRRKGGWDTHGLPVELQVEKELGLKSKKEIETYGVAAFNEKCKESVWKYVHEWEDFTKRIAYWVDIKHPYVTYKPYYIESLWQILSIVGERGLLYKDYKVVPWCPRCGTGLSSHEIAQGYETIKDLSVFVKFRVLKTSHRGQVIKYSDDTKISDTYFLAWTTTPWTLPGNVALAVGAKIEYVEVEIKETGEHLILAKERLEVLKDKEHTVTNSYKGSDLVGWTYEALYPFISENVSDTEKDKLSAAFKIYEANFVTTTDGTGIVHTAVMYGQDDFELGTKVGLPKVHLVNEDGTFKKEVGFLAGMFVKDENTDVAIIKDLAYRQPRNLLFDKVKYEHSYPFCWRCHTALIYYARDSWYIGMSQLRNELVKENESINWEPSHIKEGRFGEWLREVKDWAISRERYWGTPLPIWICEKCGKKRVVGSVSEIARKSRNSFHVMRHGEAENNVLNILNYGDREKYGLTEKGRQQVLDSAKKIAKTKFDLILVSPLRRARETAEIVRQILGLKPEDVVIEDRLQEYNMGVLDNKPLQELFSNFPDADRFEKFPEGGEHYGTLKKRMGGLLYELDNKYEGKNILLVSHETPSFLLLAAAMGFDKEQSLLMENRVLDNAEIRKVEFAILPHNDEYELDLHKPFIDEVKLECDCGGTMSRVKEVMDVWFDSGAMPFAQDHYPFENKKFIDKSGYPADFISEAIDQTRGWFYTLHAIGVLMGKGKAYKNVICLGHILDSKGKKMSKSIGNVVNPGEMMDKYCADALRFWMYSVNQPGDSKNFDEKTVDEIVKKVFNITTNVLSFYELYADPSGPKENDVNVLKNELDLWIIARLNQLIKTATDGLEKYQFFEPTRAIKDFVADFSQWYIRRSRDRFKGDDVSDKASAIATTRYILLNLAKIMAPFTPYFAEHIYVSVKGPLESVHLETWPKFSEIDSGLLESMEKVRSFASNGLEARMKSKINVRQPLQKLILKSKHKFSPGMINILKDEVNVKEVVFDENAIEVVSLDTVITPILKEEGAYRELVRIIQDMRKTNKLTVNDRATLTIETDEIGKQFVINNEAQLKKATLLGEIKYEDVSSGIVSEPVKIGELSFRLNVSSI